MKLTPRELVQSMKSALAVIGLPLTFRILSVAACLYFAVAAFGRTGSYLDAVNSIALFYVVWGLGRGSVSRGQA